MTTWVQKPQLVVLNPEIWTIISRWNTLEARLPWSLLPHRDSQDQEHILSPPALDHFLVIAERSWTGLLESQPRSFRCSRHDRTKYPTLLAARVS